MSQFTIEEVLGEERFTIEGKGEFVAYEVRFSGEQGSGVAQHKRKAQSPEPKPGETIDGELIQRNGRTELKRIWQPNAPSAGRSPSAGGSGEYRTPQQIMRGDAHGKAMHWCDIKVAAGEWVAINWEEYLAMVQRFYDDIKGAS